MLFLSTLVSLYQRIFLGKRAHILFLFVFIFFFAKETASFFFAFIVSSLTLAVPYSPSLADLGRADLSRIRSPLLKTISPNTFGFTGQIMWRQVSQSYQNPEDILEERV
jgi:hypothetical protein